MFIGQLLCKWYCLLSRQAISKIIKRKVCLTPSLLETFLSSMQCCPSLPWKPNHYHLPHPSPSAMWNIQALPIFPDGSPIFASPLSAQTDLSSEPKKESTLIYLSVAQAQTYFGLRDYPMAEKMSQGLPHQQESLGAISRMHIQAKCTLCAFNPSTGRAVTGTSLGIAG